MPSKSSLSKAIEPKVLGIGAHEAHGIALDDAVDAGLEDLHLPGGDAEQALGNVARGLHLQESGAFAEITRIEFRLHPSRMGRENKDAIANHNRLMDRVGDKHHRKARLIP